MFRFWSKGESGEPRSVLALDRYEAKVRHNGQRIHVGRFVTLEEAEAAVIAKRNELYTHNDLDRQ